MATIAVGVMAVFVLSLMYLAQAISRHREREDSRLALEQAHQALEQKHRDLHVLSEELRRQSITDPLTGVFNRRFFMESVAATVSAANRHCHALSIIMIDVDHFKKINDVHGHPAGDKVLRTLAALYKDELRDADMLARYGGVKETGVGHNDWFDALGSGDRARLMGRMRPGVKSKSSSSPLEADQTSDEV